MVMADPQLDADGYSEEIRRSMVETALARVRARGFKPQAEVLALYARYVAGAISRQEASDLMQERLEWLCYRMVGQQKQEAVLQ